LSEIDLPSPKSKKNRNSSHNHLNYYNNENIISTKSFEPIFSDFNLTNQNNNNTHANNNSNANNNIKNMSSFELLKSNSSDFHQSLEKNIRHLVFNYKKYNYDDNN